MTPQPAATPAKSQTTSILVIVGFIAVAGCCIVGILAAIAIPNFMKFQGRSKQSEAKVNLKGIYSAQKSVLAEHDEYSTDPTKLGVTAMGGTRYTCFLSPTAAVPPTKAAAIAYSSLTLTPDNTPGVKGVCPECQFTEICAGNVDNDDGLDIWSISSVTRACGPAGTPCNDQNDMTD